MGKLSEAGENTLAPGQRLDRYEIRELIGQGGMGAVYRAIDTKLGRTVALKTMRADRNGARAEAEVRTRFLREALAASKVDHRNVVRLLDFAVTEGGTPYFVMEYLRGRDLGRLLKERPGFMPVDEVVDLILGVCAAVNACHEAGIIHRDLKPANIFLADSDTGWEVKVLDFGVSKAPVLAELTQDGQILGTPQYLSPEQVNGQVVPETDQYAIGVLLYTCLTKRLPYDEHESLMLLRAVDAGRFPPPRSHRPDIPEALEAVVLRAMRRNPSERFLSVFSLGQSLWKHASPSGQLQWRSYYLDNPRPARRAKESTHGPAAIEVLAGVLAPGPTDGPPPAALRETAALSARVPDADGNVSVSNVSTRVSPLSPQDGVGGSERRSSRSAPASKRFRFRRLLLALLGVGFFASAIAIGYRLRDRLGAQAPVPSAGMERPPVSEPSLSGGTSDRPSLHGRPGSVAPVTPAVDDSPGTIHRKDGSRTKTGRQRHIRNRGRSLVGVEYGADGVPIVP